MNPEISIVLPTHNGAKYISRSIESCLNQSFRHFELIIVNDASSDDTLAIVEKYKKLDPRIRIINNTVNKKLPLSLNIGFESATGIYHTWTSDDNYYAPEALEFLYKKIKENPETGFVYTNYTVIDENDREIRKRTFGDINIKFTNFQGCSACFLYSSKLFQITNGYNPAALLIEDYDFFVRCFLETNVLYVNRYDLYYYREHPGSLTSAYGNSVNDISKLMIERLMGRLEKKLPIEQLKLLYRKFAVYHAVKKNYLAGYKTYLIKLSGISKTEVLKTVLYVSVIKTWYTIKFGANGFWSFLKLFISGK